jgi:hypothetical protein
MSLRTGFPSSSASFLIALAAVMGEESAEFVRRRALESILNADNSRVFISNGLFF